MRNTQNLKKNIPCGFDKSADLISKRPKHKEEDFYKLCVLLKKSEL